MDILVDSSGFLTWTPEDGETRRVRCALGRGGTAEKTGEGDGITPIGSWPLRSVMVRADRITLPEMKLAVSKIMPNDGWCDDPTSQDYNMRISLPHPASHETLNRDDHLYDIIIEVGFNDDPIVPGKGSAIFIHLARENYGSTEGCVALAQNDLIELLAYCDSETRLIVQ